MKIFAAAAAMLISSGAQAQEVVWPADLKASLEGIWVSEWGGLKVEVKDGNVFVRDLGRTRGGIYRDALNKQIATIGEFDRSLDMPTYRTFTATCFNLTSNWKPHECKGTINRVNTGRKYSVMSFAHGLFHPEKEYGASSAPAAETAAQKPASPSQPVSVPAPRARASYPVEPRPEPCRVRGCARPI